MIFVVVFVLVSRILFCLRNLTHYLRNFFFVFLLFSIFSSPRSSSSDGNIYIYDQLESSEELPDSVILRKLRPSSLAKKKERQAKKTMAAAESAASSGSGGGAPVTDASNGVLVSAVVVVVVVVVVCCCCCLLFGNTVPFFM